MPLYEYGCSQCGETSEILVGVTADESKPVCSSCGSSRLKRKFSRVNFSVAGSVRPFASSEADCACGNGSGECCSGAEHTCGAGCSCHSN